MSHDKEIPNPEIMSPSKEPFRIKIENVAEAIVSTSPVGISVQTESVKPQLNIPYEPDYPQRLGFLDGQFDFIPAESPEDPDWLIGEVTESSFYDYKNNKPQDATPLGAAGVVLIRKDGQPIPCILIGIRGPLNRAYSEQLTLTAVAGMMDVKRQEDGLIEPLTDELIDDTFIREGEEEIGLDRKKIIEGGMKKIAYIKDLIKPHGELGLLVEVDQTVDELAQEAAKNTSKIDFAERFVEVEDPLAAIELIATQGDPIPPTHLLVGLAAGFNIAMKYYVYSKSQARDWVARMEKGASENALRNDQLIQKYWSERPLTARLGRWRADRNGNYENDITHTPNTEGYDPDYPNTQQGFDSEHKVLHRLGLIKENNQEETLPPPTFAINADFDGVLLDINTKKMDRKSRAENIVRLLQQGAIFGGNTGRAAEHAENEVLDKIEAIIDQRGMSRKYLDRIFVVCEKGGEVIRYEDGERQRFVRPDLAASENFNQVREDIVNLLNTDEELARFYFNDTDKRTMISLEKHKAPDDINPNQWQEAFTRLQQTKLVPLLKEMLRTRGLSGTLEVDPTTIATDIQTKEANKGHAAEIYHEYLLRILKEHNINVKNFEVRSIGDSASDFPSHARMDKLGYRSTFYAVGKNQLENVDTTGHEDKIIISSETHGDYYDQAAKRIFKEWANTPEKSSVTDHHATDS